MGTTIGDALFSTTQQRVLGILFGDPDRPVHVSEIIARAGGGRGAVQRELARLEQSGLVVVSRFGNQKRYQANAGSPVFAELRSIVRKTFGLANVVGAALAPLADRIVAAGIYGSVARGEDTAGSDVDVLVISDVLDYADMYGALEAATAALGRTVNPTLFTRTELERRLSEGQSFTTRVLDGPVIWLLGDRDAVSVGKPVRSGEAAGTRAR